MNDLKIIGWREWILLDELGLPPIKAKIDTGAKTSALHAFSVRSFKRKGELWVRFKIHPVQDDMNTVKTCEAPVIDQRVVSDSGGHKQKRYVIQTIMQMGNTRIPVEMTLTNRDNMKFRALIGRRALEGQYLVDSDASFNCGGSKFKPPEFN